MRKFVGLLVLFVAVATLASGEEVELTGGANGLKAYVTKRGGKIRVYRELMTRNGTKSTGTVEISIDQIQEVDSNFDALKPSAKVSAFANVDFTVQPVSNVQLGNSSGVYADCLNCSGVLGGKVGGDTAISLAVCAIRNNGSLIMNNEVTSVTKGQLKFTFTMTSWGTWTNLSNKLAVDINIKTPPIREIVNGSDASKKPTKFSFGDGVFMEFSRMACQDNQWITMPTGYPAYKSNGANNIIQLIFNQFNSTAVYDPSVEVGYPADGGSTDPNAASTAVVSFLPLLAAALLQILIRV